MLKNGLKELNNDLLYQIKILIKNVEKEKCYIKSSQNFQNDRWRYIR